MTAKVTVLQTGAGIQRDGTTFAAPTYVDGQWVRFQYGRPRKIGGYNGAFLNAEGISRGVILNSQNGITWVISGFANGVQQWTIANDEAVGTGPITIFPIGPITSVAISNGGTGYANGTYTNVSPVPTSGNGSGATLTVVVSGNVVSSLTLTNAGTGYGTNDTFQVLASSIGGLSAIQSTVQGISYTIASTGTTTLAQWQALFSTLVTIPSVGDVIIATATGTLGGTGTFTSTYGNFVGSITATSYYASNPNTLWQWDIGYDPYGTGNYNLIGHPGQNLQYIDNQTNVRPLIGPFTGTTLSPVGVFTASGTTTSGSPNVTFATTNVAMGAGVTVTGAGIPANTKIVSSSLVAGVWTVVLNNNATASATTTLTFDNNISVSGGVVMLYPYLFVYGNYGLIQNCSAGDFNNWTSADSNVNNVASNKIVKGLPLRGGTTSPSGLFWSLDSVIRVTYSPQTVGTSTLYWRYDLISSQSSIMSSQCVIEYDGIIYWVGVDRFLMYNGVVQEIANTQNMNWFFDGLNILQRQKVWVSKIPRWGEIWWFYPRGNSIECNDAIIYNVREKCWYDAGLADGANRSAGYFSDVFRKPIWAGNKPNTLGSYTLWVQESGENQTYLTDVNAINSYFETNVLGTSNGLVGSAQGAGDNLWTRLDRVEPDFQQSGAMQLVVTGKGYADDTDIESKPYTYDYNTLKIDMKEQRREMRLRFISNIVNGNYFMGRVVLNVETGDVRGTGNP
jgi:hypothetical protein